MVAIKSRSVRRFFCDLDTLPNQLKFAVTIRHLGSSKSSIILTASCLLMQKSENAFQCMAHISPCLEGHLKGHAYIRFPTAISLEAASKLIYLAYTHKVIVEDARVVDELDGMLKYLIAVSQFLQSKPCCLIWLNIFYLKGWVCQERDIWNSQKPRKKSQKGWWRAKFYS